MPSNLLNIDPDLKNPINEKSNAWYKSVVDASPSGIMTLDKDGNITFASNKACQILRMTKDDLTNTNVIDLIHPDHREEIINSTRQLYKGSDFDRSTITLYPTKSLEIHIEGTACLYRDEEGRKLGLIMIFNDITEKFDQAKIIQQQIKDLNAKNEELKKYIDSNLQLENFAYIASHDLKAPIRSVISFAQLLADSAEDKFSEKENKFLEIIKDSSNHMRELIDDLLIFSRVNTTNTVFVEVDVEDLINSILADLQTEIMKYDAVIETSSLPKTIVADKTKIRQVFQNLIANAMKFQEEGMQPSVKIYASESNKFWKFEITDNGIGIDPKHIDKIFLLFQKLHSKDKYEGSGMGLAISKKVVEQHSGNIFARNNEDRGCTIGFTISKTLHPSS